MKEITAVPGVLYRVELFLGVLFCFCVLFLGIRPMVRVLGMPFAPAGRLEMGRHSATTVRPRFFFSQVEYP